MYQAGYFTPHLAGANKKRQVADFQFPIFESNLYRLGMQEVFYLAQEKNGTDRQLVVHHLTANWLSNFLRVWIPENLFQNFGNTVSDVTFFLSQYLIRMIRSCGNFVTSNQE